jgi:glycosyltransferase involved in cell wall biosynthesis/predicted metal-dependent phosphoesterase TrpH
MCLMQGQTMLEIRPRPSRATSPEPGSGGAFSRIDLHLHTAASGEATNWWVKAIGLGSDTRESNTTPHAAYQMAKRAGMDFVAITDHETIDGARTLAGCPDLLIGEEINATFPEDGSTVDVLVYGIDLDQHAALQALRPDVYRLVDALREMKLPHVLAHPLFAPEGRLTRAMVEKRMVLFGLWEVINGSRPAAQNNLAAAVARSADASMLRQLAVIHRLAQPPHARIAGVGGSDDHGGIYGGTTWTAIPHVESVDEVLEALSEGAVTAGGEHGSVDRMVHTGIRIASQALADQGRAEGADGLAGRLASLPLLALLSTGQVREAVGTLYAQQVARALAPVASPSRLLELAGMAGRFVEAHMMLAPHLGVSGYFGRERNKARTLEALLPAVTPRQPVRAGIFVDDFDSTHGVSTFYRAIRAMNGSDVEVELIHCGGSSDGISLPLIAGLPLPMYGDLRLPVPSLLDVLSAIERLDLDVVHIAAPGPLGIAAMTAARTLGLPVVGGYHTEFGAYARQLSGDTLVGEMVEVLVRQWFEHCDLVIVPSRATEDALAERGYRLERVEVISNGVDSRTFDPARRNDAWRNATARRRTLLLYAGRISREKGLDAFARAYLELCARRNDLHLVLAGDGPFRSDLESLLGEHATFTGMLDRAHLAEIMASCDLFVFPSETDTLGRVVVEAQASGLPAVVFAGGPAECLIPGCTGVVARRGDLDHFLQLAEALAGDPLRRRRMANAAREWACSMDWQAVRTHLDRLYRQVAEDGSGRQAPLALPSQVAPFLGRGA